VHPSQDTALKIQLLGTFVAACVQLTNSNASNKMNLFLHFGVMKSYHSFLYTELFQVIKKCLLSNPNCMNSSRYCLSTGCVYVGVTG
jgi:hypothetical protein